MPAPLLNFPMAAIVDGIISYVQYVFGKPEVTPAEYRWDIDDRKSRIRIGAPFVIDNQKPMSAPFIVVERDGFQYDDRIIDNLKSSDANSFDNSKYLSITDGYVNIICGARVASEASSIANFISMMLQSDRHGIIENLKFIRNLKHVFIGPEVPVVKDAEVRRWEVTLKIFVSIQEGWIKSIQEPVTWDKFAIYNTNQVGEKPFSTKGIVSIGSDLLTDTTKDFGPYITNNPQLLDKELAKGWYYIRLSDNPNSQLYTISEIVDNHTLRLKTHDVNNNQVSWSSPESKIDVSYELLWNAIHLYIEVPKA